MINDGNAITKRTLGFLSAWLMSLACTHNVRLVASQPQYAVCIVPVADVLGGPVASENLAWYEQKICADNLCERCKRIDQLLFNEVVEVQQVRDNGKQVCIKLPGKMYETNSIHVPIRTGWVLSKNLRYLHDLNITTGIPAPLGIQRCDFAPAIQNTIVLKEPYPMPGTRQLFSVGTRFVIKEVEKKSYELWWFNPQKNAIDTFKIPAAYCIAYDPNLTIDQRRQLMVDIARSWCRKLKEIAYVWGGCSLINACRDQVVHASAALFSTSGIPLTFDRNQPGLPRTGFDCSGLICRSAHMAGIPLFYKNTITMARHMREVTNINALKAGDIIWLPGHVMLVSSIEHNLLIEARHYVHGYGRVHEIPLEEEFAGIKNYKDLLATIEQKKPIMRKDRSGKEVQKMREIKVLSLESA